MTIREASAVNTMISSILGSPSKTVTEDRDLEEAMVYLAERASKALMAGWSGERVRTALKRQRTP